MRHWKVLVSMTVCHLAGGLFSVASHAQPVLIPSIGQFNTPAYSDPICTLPFQTPPMSTVGRFEGDTAANFRGFDMNGGSFELGSALLEKPVLMVAGSYTCPVFMNKIPVINSLQAMYGDQIEILIVYTVEAHPYIDISPYFGAVNTSAANISAGILYQQPTTYGERIAVMQDMAAAVQIDVPIYIDGPCNEWWNYYGPAPNIAYLIGMDGMIHTRHTWFHHFPEDMICDIDDLLGQPSDCEESFGGSFTLEWITNDTIYGPTGSTITVTTRMNNTSNLPVLVEVHRLENNMPGAWSSSLCLDVCYMTDVDYADIVIPANSFQDFHYYFYTDQDPAHGHARVGLRNSEDQSNGIMLNFHAFSTPATSIGELVNISAGPNVWPNPTNGILHIGMDHVHDRITLQDAHGRIMIGSGKSSTLALGDLSPGIYILRCWDQGKIVGAPKRVQVL